MKSRVGETVQDFYNRSPFPDFETARFKTTEDLKRTARHLPRMLNVEIPLHASVIDVGTGTGQLAAFLSLKRKVVYGIDFSEGSLKKARALKQNLKLDTFHIKNVDIMDPNSIENIGLKFDYVLCLGVLHHTGDAEKAFHNIVRLVKPGGYVAIGLYNKFGRLPLQARIFLAKTIFKNNEAVKDYFIRLQIGDVSDKERARGWWNDQYLHPHETTHTIGEVLKWFKENDIEYCQSLPSLFFQKEYFDKVGWWDKTASPSFLRRLFKQLIWIKETHREGGYWITLGRKND